MAPPPRPTRPETPTKTRPRSSRPVAGGRPGENRGARPDRSDRRFRPGIATSFQRVLRQPLESALSQAAAVVNAESGLDRTDLIRLVEILAGSDAALALLDDRRSGA